LEEVCAGDPQEDRIGHLIPELLPLPCKYA
jgi:hypothetical protein